MILYATEDTIFIAAADIVYLPNAQLKIQKAFERFQKADIIAFNILCENDNNRIGRKNLNILPGLKAMISDIF